MGLCLLVEIFRCSLCGIKPHSSLKELGIYLLFPPYMLCQHCDMGNSGRVGNGFELG